MPEPCHAESGLKIFVVVVPKEDLANSSPAKPSFGMTSTIKCDLLDIRVQSCSRCRTTRRLGWAGAS